MPPIQFATPAPTFEDVWRMFQENAQQSREDYRLMKERSAETDRQMLETERLMKERSAETDRQMLETDRRMREQSDELKLLIKNVTKNIGDLGNRLGEFVEHAVAPAVVQLFQAQGVEVHEVHPEVSSHRDGEGIEIDLLVINDGALVAVECKSKLTHAHVDEHLERMEKLKRLFPLYKNHKALGAVAAMVMSDSVKAYAQNQGFYVLCQNGDNVVVSNTEAFTPRAW